MATGFALEEEFYLFAALAAVFLIESALRWIFVIFLKELKSFDPVARSGEVSDSEF